MRRGWTAAELFTGIHAIGRIERGESAEAPHRVALRLYRAAKEDGLLEGGLGTSPWAVRVGVLLNDDRETQALRVIADAFRDGEVDFGGAWDRM